MGEPRVVTYDPFPAAPVVDAEAPALRSHIRSLELSMSAKDARMAELTDRAVLAREEASDARAELREAKRDLADLRAIVESNEVTLAEYRADLADRADVEAKLATATARVEELQTKHDDLLGQMYWLEKRLEKR